VLQNDPVTQHELRQFEAQIDAQFQDIAARFVGIEERFAVLGDRLVGIDQQLQALARSSEARCGTVERRIDASRTRTDEVRTAIVSRMDDTLRDLTRIVLLGLIGTALATAMLCLGTIVLVL
jgi:hypothetical protein